MKIIWSRYFQSLGSLASFNLTSFLVYGLNEGKKENLTPYGGANMSELNLTRYSMMQSNSIALNLMLLCEVCKGKFYFQRCLLVTKVIFMAVVVVVMLLDCVILEGVSTHCMHVFL